LVRAWAVAGGVRLKVRQAVRRLAGNTVFMMQPTIV
jgi:hypothetical protein